LKQYFSTKNAKSVQNNVFQDVSIPQNTNNETTNDQDFTYDIKPVVQFESTILGLPQGLQSSSTTTTNTSTHTTNNNIDINPLFPTFQHISMFVALFSSQEDWVNDNNHGNDDTNDQNNDGQNNKNLSTTKRQSISPATISAIIDAAVMDAVRDNIRYQKSQQQQSEQQKQHPPSSPSSTPILPLTPKNIITGLSVICSYKFTQESIQDDLKVVEKYLEATANLVLDAIDDTVNTNDGYNETINTTTNAYVAMTNRFIWSRRHD
jgi:hypothetical protein